jgi:TfoX/Sxy family transcriptional regulator of competence genes
MFMYGHVERMGGRGCAMTMHYWSVPFDITNSMNSLTNQQRQTKLLKKETLMKRYNDII